MPEDDYYPEVLQINIIDIVLTDEGHSGDEGLQFTVDPAEYVGKKVLAVPRCCQKRKGTTDRKRVNGEAGERRLAQQGFDRMAMMNLLTAWGGMRETSGADPKER